MLPFLLLYVSLWLLRYQLMVDLGLRIRGGLDLGVELGWIYDLAMVLIALALTRWTSVLTRGNQFRASLPWMFLIWISALSSVIYFRFFHNPLYWWVVRLHWKDLWLVKGSAGELASTPWMVGSALLFLSALLISYLHERGSLMQNRSHGRRILEGLGILVIALLVRQSPVWAGLTNVSPEHRDGVLGSQILLVWYDEIYGKTSSWDEELLSEVSSGGDSTQKSISDLLKYRETGREIKNRTDPVSLLHSRVPEPALTREYRNRMGLPAHGKIHVIVLFMESVRAFEFLYPEIRDAMYPALNKEISRHGLFFQQAYASAFTAGQTVRGQFATLCSMLPNMLGPATYIAFSALRVRCLPSLFLEAGYETLWMNTLPKNFHNSALFESLHGTKNFYDFDYFKSRGIAVRIGDWGLADHEFFDESLKLLNERHERGENLFVNMLTVSTHVPHKILPDYPPPEKMSKAPGISEQYLSYVSTLRYADFAISAFVRDLFASPMGERTLLVMLGDHSIPIGTPYPLTDIQNRELLFRVPILFMTKNMKTPRAIQTPIHQIDVAPTISDIAGVGGEVTWLGRNPLLGTGSSWVYSGGMDLAWRTSTTGCYPFPPDQKRKCVALDKGDDPLLNGTLPEGAEDKAHAEFFGSLVKSVRKLISFNRIMPAPTH